MVNVKDAITEERTRSDFRPRRVRDLAAEMKKTELMAQTIMKMFWAGKSILDGLFTSDVVQWVIQAFVGPVFIF